MKRYTTRGFPPYRHRPGRTPHPVLDEEGHSHGQEEAQPAPFVPSQWKSSEDYLWGVDLFNHQYFWEAHEAWEGIWRTVRDQPQGDFLRGLIQVAAAFLKGMEGRKRGMRSLRQKAYRKLRPLAESQEAYCGIDLRQWMSGVDQTLFSLGEGEGDGEMLEGLPSQPGSGSDSQARSDWRIRLAF